LSYFDTDKPLDYLLLITLNRVMMLVVTISMITIQIKAFKKIISYNKYNDNCEIYLKEKRKFFNDK